MELITPGKIISHFEELQATLSEHGSSCEYKKYLIDPLAEFTESPAILKYNKVPLASLGNFSLIIGKPKSRKTTWAYICVAACLGATNIIDGIESMFVPIDKVIFFDTEQSPYHASITLKRIARHIGKTGLARLEYCSLRPLSPSERLRIVEEAINQSVNIKMIVIDGVRDLLTYGINNEEEATELTSNLLRWTTQKNIHIMLVLHQNKNDLNARGHIGSELINKAETVLSISKDPKRPDISIVNPDYTRDRVFPQFAFTIGEDGLPSKVGQEPTTNKSNEMAANFAKVLSANHPKGHNCLKTEYMKLTGVSDGTSKNHIKKALKEGILMQNDSRNYQLSNMINSDENE